MRRIVTILAALSLVIVAGGRGTPRGAPESATLPSNLAVASTSAQALPGGELERCESPEGFAISAPAAWATNEGDVVAPCTQFNPEPFEVARGTDKRVAAITAYVETVEYATAARPVDGEEDRAVTAVDGRQAVRVSYETAGEGLYPPGIPITRYLVDVERSNGEPATLIVDTLGTDPFDYERNIVVLDRMVQTLDITDQRVETDPSVIATYLGGGGGFSVTAQANADAICLRIPPNGESVCTDPPAADQVHTIALTDLNRTVHAGVTGADVWRVDLVTPANETHSYLPAAVPGTELGAYAFHDTVDGFERLMLYDITGDLLRTIAPGGGPPPGPPATPDLYVVKLDGPEGTEMHILDGATSWDRFRLHAGTAQHDTNPAAWQFAVGDYNGDGVHDLYVIKQRGASGTEVHVLDGASDYQRWLLHTATPLHTTGDNWRFEVDDFDGDGRRDVYAINPTGVTGTEVHILSGARDYQGWLAHLATAQHQTGQGWQFGVGDYDRDGVPDVYLIAQHGASGTTEVHVLDGDSSYGGWLLHTGTALEPTGENWDFDVADQNGDGLDDLFAINRGGASGTTEIHVLENGSAFGSWLVQTPTAQHPTTDDNWAFAVG